MKKLSIILSILIFSSVLFFAGCKNDETSLVVVSYFPTKDADGKKIIEANIANRSGNAMTNIKIDFTDHEHRIIEYTFTGVICSGQNTDVVVNTEVDFNGIESYKVTSCEATTCK